MLKRIIICFLLSFAMIMVFSCSSNSQNNNAETKAAENNNAETKAAEKGNGSFVTAAKKSNSTSTSNSNSSSDASISASDIEIISSRIYEKERWNSTFCVIVLKNNGSVSADVTISSVAYDANDNVIGAGNESVKSLGANCITALEIPFRDTVGVEKCDSKIDVKSTKTDKSILQDLKLEVNALDKKVIVSCTNEGEKTGSFIKCFIVYLDKDGNIVNTDSVYLIDDENEIKPGDTITKQQTANDDYDSVEAYLQGKAK